MNALLVSRRLYRRLDASLGSVMSERTRLWLKGVAVAVARMALPSGLGRSDGMPSMLPVWAYVALNEAAIDEPELSPKLLVPYLRRVPMPTGNVSLAIGYGRLWDRIDEKIRHVFVLGDTDGRISNLLAGAIRRLATRQVDSVLVVWTGSSVASPKSLLAPARFLDLERVCGVCLTAEQAIVLGRALIELKPATIHIASSDAAWVMFRTVAAALGEYSQLYAEVLPISLRVAEGDASEAARSIAADLPPIVEFVVSSERTSEQLVERYGVDQNAIRKPFENAHEGVALDQGEGGVGCDWLSNLPGYTE